MSDEYISVKQAMEFADTFYAHDPVARMICRALLKAVPKVEPGEQRWIPVTERLPEPMEWVLCACRANIIEVLRYDHIIDDWDTTMPNRAYMKGFVTHWMPLPEPPKQVQ